MTRPVAPAQNHPTLTRFGWQLKIGFAVFMALRVGMLVMTS